MEEKDLFDSEVADVLKKIKGDHKIIKKKLEKVYELSKRLHIFGAEMDRTEAHDLVAEILEYLFKDKFSNTFSVPMNFISSALGKVLFSVEFGVAEAVYTTAEISIIMNKTRALISHDFKNGDIKAIKKGRNIVVYERDLMRYMMTKKNMSKDEVTQRISLYTKLKHQGLTDEEIKKQF